MHYVYVSGILIDGILPYLSLTTVLLNLKCVTTLDFIIIYYSSLALSSQATSICHKSANVIVFVTGYGTNKLMPQVFNGVEVRTTVSPFHPLH